MAIWITLPGYPEKTMEGRISVSYEDGANPPRTFDFEVFRTIGFGVRVRSEEHGREGLTLDETLDVLWDHSNGDADHLCHALGITARAAIARAWDRHRERHPR